jgi:saccharopine dehydrogenase (NADP+, L-glutamate forming)
MSAMEMIDDIKAKGGQIHTFRSHCGGLISPESDDNPWHYKISWNPRNIVMAGKDGARYLKQGGQVFIPYGGLFDPGQTVDVPGHGKWSWYANRDSISYIPVYGLDGISNFVRTTLRHPDFAHGWSRIVALGLTNEDIRFDTTGMTTRSFFSKYADPSPGVKWDDPLTRSMFSYLGFFDDEPLPGGTYSAADIIQWMLERKLALAHTDRDMIIMLHEIGYRLDGKDHVVTAHMVAKGTDQQHTAMAATVGLPLAIAAVNILNGKINCPGVSIPLSANIYGIILPELEKKGLGFIYNVQ